MYEELNCFEEALKHFGTRVEVICAMELGGRITAEDAYQMVKEELKEVKSVVRSSRKMKDANIATSDSLKVEQNEDGTFTLEWDKEDPKWNFLNGLTAKEIQDMVQTAVEEGLDGPV